MSLKKIINGSINTIYVFNGKKTKETKELFDKAFTEEEREQIKKDNITVKFSEQQIHFDDSIGIIKIKILNELKKDISLDEIYLYCQKKETLNAVSVYQSLTQNKKLELTKVRLDQLLSNIVSDENGEPFEQPIEKEVYTFDDIFQMNLNKQNFIINNVLGQKKIIVDNEYPFSCDPYDVKEFDKFLERTTRKSLANLNNNLLLTSGNIIDNSIYLCLAGDVLQYLNKRRVSEETIIKIYYPFLHSKNINNLDDLEKQKDKLLEGKDKIINDKVIDTFKSVDMFYDVYNSRTSELNYLKNGIKYIKAEMKPDFSVKIPIEIIFKVIHATQERPLIKFNPATRQENVYRLFSDKNATDGRKIPFLKKATIFKLMKNIAKNKSVAVYIETVQNDKNMTLVCEFDEEGYITVSSEFNEVLKITEIDEIIRNSVNPIIEEIQILLEQNGYKLNKFNSLTQDNIVIKQLTYQSQIYIKKALDLKAYNGCISSIFINETKKSGKTQLRFKRVSNYSKFNSIEAFILEKSAQGLIGEQIIEALLENFPEDLNRNQAVEFISKIASELEVERGVRKTDIKIKNNPGFKTTFDLNRETGIVTITTENINNIYYLDTLPIYLDTIIRLTQDKKSTEVPVKEINRLCSSGEKEDIVIDDIVSSEKKSDEDSDQDEPNNRFKTANITKAKGALDMFLDEDEEFNGGNKFKGGESESSIDSEVTTEKTKSSSEKSIESEKDLSSSRKSLSESDKKLPSFPSSSESDKKLPSFPSLSESDKDLPSFPSLSESDKSSVSEEKKRVEDASSTEVSSTEEPAPKEPAPKDLAVKDPVPEDSSSEVSSTEEPTPEDLAVKDPAKEDPSSEDSSSEISSTEDSSSEISSSEDSSSEISSTEEPAPEDLSVKDPVPEEPAPEDSSSEISSSEDSSSEEEEEEEDIKNIDGMRLNKPYYFQSLIENKDPVLIIKEDTPQFNSYVRTCSSSTRKQPVILTDQQLAKINKEHPGFLREEDVIKYGSDPKNQFNYICPRYWCLKNNTVVEPNELKEVKGKDGKTELIHPTCGKVLPKGEKIVKPGYYIYEFYESKPNKKDYKKYPGLIADSHPDGLCLPCCFDKYNTEGRIKANKKCYDKNVGDKEKDNKNKEDEYIKGPDKFPLDPGRWGYLPAEIQTMLREVNADCQISKTNTSIKDNHPCLLRHGVEISNKQSFISCISDLIFFGKKMLDKTGIPQMATILNISDMKKRIIKSISIDTFIKYQNGNLVTNFQNLNKKVNIEKYNDTKLYQKLNIREKTEDAEYFTKVVSAFENFVDFLSDEDAVIDHTYLWDIITMPNKYLFPDGVNMVIFNLPKDDITNNVELLCPTNHYSSEFYEGRKPTIIIMKEDNYYEPIYTYTTNDNKIKVGKDFKERDPSLSKTMRTVFKEIIKPFFNTICRPLDSMPNVYKTKRPLLLYDLLQKLDKYDYKINKLVINFNNKVIGIFAEEPDPSLKTGFIPCYPSSIDDELKKDVDFVLMTDLSLWNTYDNTVRFLNKLSNRSKKRKATPDIPCKPQFKVVEDEHVVGILTITNQFIQLSEPLRLDEINAKLDIQSLNNNNYILNINEKPMVSADVEIMTQKGVDDVRVDYIKKIRLEANFYNVYRNTIRILLNDYENIKLREKIENEIKKEYIIYSDKFKNINSLLHELIKNKIQFIGDKNYYKLINEVSTCIVKNDTCKDEPNLCLTENGTCNLILPEKNLITEKENEPIYYGRMTDELIRYNRIKSFMFQSQTYLSFGSIGYNLRENEFILIQSLLTQEYFESLTPEVTNKYIQYNSHDETQPMLTQTYDNKVIYSQINNEINTRSCDWKVNPKITSGIWKKCFPADYNEMEYNKLNYCTFGLIINLIQRKTGKKVEINELKTELYEEYQKYLEKYHDKIINILILEGKKTLGDQVLSDKLSFSNFIYTDAYFLTPLDLWLLVTKYKIPTIFISQKFLLQTEYKKHQFVGYGNEKDEFAFIIVPGLRPENVPNYKLIQSDKDEIFISLNKLDEECLRNINFSLNETITIEDYLLNFTKPLKTRYKRKIPVKFIIQSDSEEEEKPEKKNHTNKTPTKFIIQSDTEEEDKKDDKLVTQEEKKKTPPKKKRKTNKKQIKLKGNNLTKKLKLIIQKSSETL